jgi:Flp pilus assembly protein TadD
MLVLLAPTAGCATFPFSVFHASPAPPASGTPAQASAPNANAKDLAADLESAIHDAQAQRRSGDLAGAAKSLSQLVLIAPDNAHVLGEYGKNLAAQGRSEDALAFLERAIQLQPGDWTLYSAQGMAYDQKANYREAQASYARALVLKPGEPTILNNAALSYMQAGDLDNAEKLLRQAPPGSPDYPRIAQNLALVQSLRAAQPAKMAADAPPAPEPAPTPPLPAPMIIAEAPAQAASANPPADVAAAPAVVSEPVKSAQIATPPAPEPMIVSAGPAAAPSAPPAIARNPNPAGKLAALRADPSVVLGPVPKDDKAPVALHPVVRAEALVPVKPVEQKFAPSALKLAPEAKPAALASSTQAYFVQAGAYFSEERAGVAASALDRLGAHVTSGMNDGRAVYRVRIGPFLTIEQAKTAFTQAQAMGHADLRIVAQ